MSYPCPTRSYSLTLDIDAFEMSLMGESLAAVDPEVAAALGATK